MRILIAAIGKAKSGPQKDLCDEYLKRLPWKTEIRELESKNTLAAARRAEETKLLLKACVNADRLIALDERGESFSSAEFAARIDSWRNAGAHTLGILIGGADGLDRAQLGRADLTLSFGRLTWPHQLARAMLAEQLYRAYSLLHNHPYHRA